MRTALIGTVATLAIVVSLPQVEAAQPAPKRKAVTDIAEVDRDFAFQGEYTGSLLWSGRGYRFSGLQVIARGDGKFAAALHLGGLPGNGWDRQNTRQLTGQLNDGVLSLEGDGLSVISDGYKATVYDANGASVGHLGKVERFSPTLGAEPPRGAVVLFDGSSTEHFDGGKINAEGLLEVGATTKMPVGDFRLHLEFRLPYMPYSTGQSRGNSGVYIQRRYEVQILDSFGLEGIENECASLYRQQRPDINMCFPPLAWQTYDITFKAARFDDEGNKIANAVITVLHNSVPVHYEHEIPTKTGAGRPEGPEMLPIQLQNHSDPVHFRNIWIVLQEDVAAEPEVAVRYAVSYAPRRCRLLTFLRRRCR